MKKFTFKTQNPTGKYSSFFPIHHYIKYKGSVVGMIRDKTWKIKLKVIDDNDIDKKTWEWRVLDINFQSLNEAKEYLNENIDSILMRFELFLENDE